MRIDRERLAAAMVRHDLTGKRLAELAGVSRVTVTSVRCGKSCSPETAKKLADVLGIEILEEAR